MNDFLFYVKENQTPPTYSSLNFFIFSFSPIKKKSFLMGWVAYKVESWSTHGHWVGASCILESSCLCLFIPLSKFLQFSVSPIPKHEFFVTFFVRPTKFELDTHMGNWLICCVYQTQAASTYLFFIFLFLFFLSLQLANIKNASTKLFHCTSDGYGRGYVSFAHYLLYLGYH